MNQYEIESMRDSIEETMTMTCVISRLVSSGQDPYGRPTGNWEEIYNGPCWYWEIERFRSFGSTDITGPDINVAVEGPRLQLPAGTDVNEHDRIDSVTDLFGETRALNLDLREVLHRLTDVVCLCEAFK